MVGFLDRLLKGDTSQPVGDPPKAELPATKEARAVLQDYLDASAYIAGGDSHLLSSAAVLEQSGLFAYHPVIQELGGYILDDLGTSDHHVLVTSSPLVGCVLFLAHDGDTRCVFDSGLSFLSAVHAAHESGVSVTDLHPKCSPLAEDQSALGVFVRGLLDRQELKDVVVSLIPSLNLEDIDLLRTLARDEDFFLGEAVGREIERRPSPTLLSIAELCAAHGHAQVAQAGERAVRRIRQLG